MLKVILKIVILLIVGAVVWVRVAPDDPLRWHVAAEGSEMGHIDGEKDHVYREAVTGDVNARMAAFDAQIRATPRTKVLAGSLAEGQITYVTRSRLMAFPDYTTLTLRDATTVELYSRARFGKSDLGVNRARIESWIKALG
ncbi:DUF1499 domain-containing protein [Marinovum sp. 2_MG-2023]|uniref:DUF1499 domain-containing protein n=1 Tax=unclassified Marinovum TaxID=2647166 RepID=UPI0026E4067A|nr:MULTISPECIES: DUF1499 domain-containing protein [unclassified Marinovum]MDO6730497.1 DUF1499 domain-containing protein [Marinovum sp. 2_MG-2023]MDO6778477.1 DUF1499 domain-containing protein [Marinovum sp. 1_MG-2023]